MKTITYLLFILLLSACATSTDPCVRHAVSDCRMSDADKQAYAEEEAVENAQEEQQRAAARSREVDRSVLRLQIQDLCWRAYDGEHGCYLPP